MKPKQKKSGHWTGNEDQENVRNYFDEFAQSQGLDPLNVATWYTFKPKDYHVRKKYKYIN